jgi:uncharacterized protein (TIGR03435 family)
MTMTITTHFLCGTTVWLPLAASVLFGQSQATRPAFEVASVKPSAPYAKKAYVGVVIDGGKVDIESLPLATLIAKSYRVKLQQVSGPDWLNSAKFDILARMPEGASPDQVPEMLQKLLAEKFKLAVHRESRKYQVYALIVKENSPKLKEAPPGADPGLRPSAKPDGMIHYSFTNNLATFADFLALFVGRQVVDLTGLRGVYQGEMDVPGSSPPRAGKAKLPEVSDPRKSPFFDAVKQIGLKLESRKVPMETIVVDHAEKEPTEN